jgi:hypothetical protein
LRAPAKPERVRLAAADGTPPALDLSPLPPALPALQVPLPLPLRSMSERSTFEEDVDVEP